MDFLGYTPTEKNAWKRSPITPNIFHTWGCPVFVLNSRHQSAVGSVLKWEPRSRMGVYIGFLSFHPHNVALVFNPTTGFVSSQYHTVFEESFSNLEYVRKQVQPPHWSVLVKNASQLTTDDFFPFAMKLGSLTPQASLMSLASCCPLPTHHTQMLQPAF